MADEYLNKTGLSRFWDKIKTKIPDITGKADKVSNATNGNFAALDSNGNLTDSGHKHSDYLTQHQDISGKADKVSSATTGNFAGLDSNGNLYDSNCNPYSLFSIVDGTSSGMRHHVEQMVGYGYGYRSTFILQGSDFFETSTKTTSSGVDTFTFQASSISSDSAFDVYADVYGVSPTEVTMSGNNTVQVKFNSSDGVTKCRLYVR